MNLLADGSVLSVGSGLYAGIELPAIRVLDRVSAVQAAVADVYPDRVFRGRVASSRVDGDRRTVFAEEEFGRPPQARLVLFPERDGARLTWEVRVAEPTLRTDYRLLVDAQDGRILFRRNMVVHASARVLLSGAPDPESEEVASSQYQSVTLPSSTPQSPAGWITAPGTSLAGNNATSHVAYWTEPGLAESSATYDYPYASSEAALVNAWYWANDAHDRFYAAGFDEAAGNYQTDNFGAGGLGGDAMNVVAWIGGGRDNAFYTTSVDGDSSTIQFFWVGCRNCGDHDGYPENGGERSTGFMRDTVVHEYAHGVSTRMVGGPAVDDCLGGTQSGAMAEGWSDLFGASFYDDPRVGAHFFEGPGWMREPRNDMTYSELCKVGDYGCAVHSDGMIWQAALWDLRESMIALDDPGGLDAFHRITVEGMANTACYPDMLDARDGILNADTTLYGSAHAVIWNVFARRKMGQGASSTGENDTAPVTSTTVPAAYVCTAPSTPTGLSASAPGPNQVDLSYSAAGAAAVEVWRDDLDNPLDGFVRIDSTTSTSSYSDTSAHGGKSYAYQLVALGAGGIYCRSGASASASVTATGACSAYPVFDPGLTIADGAASCALTLSWSAATAGCPGSPTPIAYNVYRSEIPGFEPSQATWIGQTASTTFQDTPPRGPVAYYLVLAQHGVPGDPPDHRARGRLQVLRWVPRIPTLGRTLVQDWHFDTGAMGWTTNNLQDPAGAWVRRDPISTRYADALLAPETAAGGSGQAWVTGDPGSPPATSTTNDSDNANQLLSPSFDGTGGKTILSFDYWNHIQGNFYSGVELEIRNGSTTAQYTVFGTMTAQDFDTHSRHGWQRGELDLSTVITPTTTMRVVFVGRSGNPLSEFGVDNVRVEQATVCSRSALTIQSVTVQDGAPGWGNGNGILEPGETARLVVTLRNDGSATATTPAGRITVVGPGVVVHEPDDSFPTIAAGGTGVSAGTGFTLTAPGAACGDTLNIQFEFTDASGTTSVDTWQPEIGSSLTETVFQDTFETDLGWMASGAGAGQGVWQRGDPVGTMDGGSQANPENDSPNDAGAKCYLTENGPVGGGVNANDVDATLAEIVSPAMDLSPYKRVRWTFDLWFYDNNSSSEYWQDYGLYEMFVDDGLINAYSYDIQWYPTSGWTSITRDVSSWVPMVPNVRMYLYGLDRDASWLAGATDNVVEMGLDNVNVEGDRPSCAGSGVSFPPNGIGSSLLLGKSADVKLTWTASPVDGSHDAAAYYEVFVSSAPDAGFSVEDTDDGHDLVTTARFRHGVHRDRGGQRGGNERGRACAIGPGAVQGRFGLSSFARDT